MISVWPKVYSFDPEMVLHFHFTFKPFPGHMQKRERARERERGRKKEERVEIIQSRAHRYRSLTSPAPRRLRKALIVIAQSFDSNRAKCQPRRSRSHLHADRDHAKCLDLMIFSEFCLCFEEWMILYICLAIEKMWATSRKCVFYGTFKNTTKHQKIFFETIFEMQPNTWKHFPFRKIAFPENRIFFENTFTRTKQSLKFIKSTNSFSMINYKFIEKS